jgi:hypothetical protein
VWPLPVAIVLCRQDQLQRIGAPERDGFRKRSLLVEPAVKKVELAFDVQSRNVVWCLLLLDGPAGLLCDN